MAKAKYITDIQTNEGAIAAAQHRKERIAERVDARVRESNGIIGNAESLVYKQNYATQELIEKAYPGSREVFIYYPSTPIGDSHYSDIPNANSIYKNIERSDNKLHIATTNEEEIKQWEAIGLQKSDPQKIPDRDFEREKIAGCSFFTVDFNDDKQFEAFTRYLLERAAGNLVQKAADVAKKEFLTCNRELDYLYTVGENLEIPVQASRENTKRQLKEALGNAIAEGESPAKG